MTGPVADSSAAVDSWEAPEAGSDLVGQAIRRFQEGKDREGSFRFLYETYFRAIERFFQIAGIDGGDGVGQLKGDFHGAILPCSWPWLWRGGSCIMPANSNVPG